MTGETAKELTDCWMCLDHLFYWIWRWKRASCSVCSIRAVDDFGNWSTKLQMEKKKKRSNTDLKKRDVSVTDTQRVISALTPTWHVLLPIFRAPLDRCSLPRGSRRPASRSPGEIWESLWDKQRKRELKSLIGRAHFPHLRVCRNGFSARLCKAASLCQRD